MGIKDKKVGILWELTEKSDFEDWLTQKIYIGEFF